MNDDVTAQVRAAAHALLSQIDAAGHDDDAIARSLDNCLDALNRLGLIGEGNRLPSSELWNIAGHRLARGWLQHRARTKPRGYAGDHELLERIYHGRLTDDPLGACFDRYFQAAAAPQAVRNRMKMMTGWLAEALSVDPPQNVHVAVVGSAAALEISAAIQKVSTHKRSAVRVTLLDIDPAALEFARTLLAPLLTTDQLCTAAANLFRLPDRPQLARPLAGADLIFCPGLFDYLADDAASRMLAVLYQPLAPGGRLVVFQFAPHNPPRAYMEWFGNWYLIYRSLAELQRVVATAQLPGAAANYGAEPLGIDLYVTLTKTSPLTRHPAPAH